MTNTTPIDVRPRGPPRNDSKVEVTPSIAAPLQLLREAEVAAMLAVAPKTLRAWRGSSRGPRYIKISGAVRYELSDIREFIDSARKQSTSQYT